MLGVEQIYFNFWQKGKLTNELSCGLVVFFLQLEQSKLEGAFWNWSGRISSNVTYVRNLNYSTYIYVLMTTVSNPEIWTVPKSIDTIGFMVLTIVKFTNNNWNRVS